MPVAMELSMIVETTSLTPRHTFSNAAIAAHTPPTTIATRRMKLTWRGAGSVTAAPAAAANTAARRYCPSTPMLNRAILKPMATASART